jgi:hypothetical protein
VKPRKAHARVIEAYNNDADCLILLSTGKVVRGVITEVRADVEPLGPPGQMVAGNTSIRLNVELKP